MLIGFQDKKENEHTENFSTNTENRLGKLSVNRMQSRINQNVVKFYSPKTIRLYLDLTR